MTRKQILFPGILLAVLAVLTVAIWSWLHFRPAPPLFIRLDIASSLHDPKVSSIDPRSGEIQWQGKKKDRSRVAGIGGAGFVLKGKKSFSFAVPKPGNWGFCCYYDLRSDNITNIAMVFQRWRRGTKAIMGWVPPGQSSGYFIQKFDAQPGDRFELHWRGRGNIFVDSPVIYRILPVGERKTIVMLAADALRGDQIDAKVGNVAVAPFLASFSRGECARFDRCLSASTWTLPSFASLFTARNEIVHGLNTRTILDAGQPFLVEAIADSYITFNFNGGIFMDLQSGFSRGFDYFREGGYYGDRKTLNADSLLRGALELLQKADFPAVFLFLHTYQVHIPYNPPADLLRRLDPANPALASGVFPDGPATMASTASEKEHYFRLYQAEVSVLDREVERFLSGLKQAGLYQQAMFILFGDHGDAFGEHGMWDHGHSLYNELIHVPLLIKFPASRFAGRNVAMPVSLTDLFPTLLDWLDIPAPKVPLNGVSLMPSLKSGVKRPEPIVSSLLNAWLSADIPPQLALSFSRYKVIVTFAAEKGGQDKVRVYDLERDPQEKEPISAPPSAIWQQSLPIIRLYHDYLQKPRKKSGKEEGKDLGPEMREQLEQMKAMGYL